MIIWKCPNPKCNINNALQKDSKLLMKNKENPIHIYNAQCSNCLKEYEIIINIKLKELTIKRKNNA